MTKRQINMQHNF